MRRRAFQANRSASCCTTGARATTRRRCKFMGRACSVSVALIARSRCSSTRRCILCLARSSHDPSRSMTFERSVPSQHRRYYVVCFVHAFTAIDRRQLESLLPFAYRCCLQRLVVVCCMCYGSEGRFVCMHQRRMYMLTHHI